MRRDTKAILTVVVLVTIISIIIGIWFAKNHVRLEMEKGVQQAELVDAVSGADRGFEIANEGLEIVQLDIDGLKKQGLPIMLDFGASWCPPCKEMAPILQEVYEEYKGKVIIHYIDVDKAKEVARNYPIEAVPTQFFFDSEGNPYKLSVDKRGFLTYVDRETGEHGLTAHQGFMSKEDILEVFKDLGVEIND